MHNPVKRTVKLELDGGRTFNLFFDFEAIATVEELLDMAIITGLDRKHILKPTVKMVRAMFLACALSEHPLLTYDEVKNLVTMKSLPVIWSKVMEAWFNHSAPASEDADSHPTPDQK